MKKVIPSTIICHKDIRPEVCFIRIEMAKERGYLVVESVDDPRYLEYMEWAKDNPPPQVHSSLVNKPTQGEVGLGSAFALGLVIVLIICAFRYLIYKRKQSEQEYEPVYALNPWEDERLFPDSDAWPDMQQVFPRSQRGGSPHDRGGGTRRTPPRAGKGGQAGIIDVRGTQHPTPPPNTPLTPSFTPPSHYALELAPALPAPVLKLLPFEPKELIQLFEYDAFKELFKYYPDMKRDDVILVIWGKKKGGNNPGYEAAKSRYSTFKGNMDAANNEWKQ